MLAKVLTWIHNLQFKTKLISLFVTMNILTIVIYSIIYYYTNVDKYEELVKNNALDIISKNNNITDVFLENIQESINKFSYDEDAYETILNIDESSEYSVYQADKDIQDIMKRYFDQDITESIILVTSSYVLGYGQWSYEHWLESDLYKNVRDAKGSFVWLPTFEFARALKLDYMYEIDYEHKFLFSCAKEMTIFRSSDAGILRLPEDKEKPILLINFNSNYFSEFYNKAVPVENTEYYVVDKDYSFVYNNSDRVIEKEDIAKIIEDIGTKESGILSFRFQDKKDYIICYDQSEVTDWITLALIDKSILTNKTKKNMATNNLVIPVMMIMAAFIAVFISSNQITKPLRKLIVAFDKTKKGEFGTTVEVRGKNDIDEILIKFNRMSLRIEKLIVENYMVKLHEKEAQIKALNFQLQPHFLYNTLNLVNCMAIENNQMETSKIMISLSNMLRYTAQNDKEMGILEEEINWLKQYIYIMNCRFEGKITVHYDIDECIMKTEVPRLFLQPFVENAFVHGFKDMNDGWEIKITVKLMDDKRIFIIEDNGKGIANELIEEINKGKKINMGINNVRERLKLLYGEKSYLHISLNDTGGTTVRIIIPM